MKTRCPYCNTRFMVTDEVLAIADGKVRCGRCKEVFDARDFFIGEQPEKVSPEQPAEPEKLPSKTTEVEDLDVEIKTPDKDEINEDDIPSILMDDIEAHENPEPKRHPLAWFTGAIFLALVLVTQYAYFNRNTLSQQVVLRPYLEALCQYANCTLPLMDDASRGIETIKTIRSEINPNPKDKKRLLASITLVNAAPYIQAYPVLELRLTDMNNRNIAARRFQPEEYLKDKKYIPHGITPNEPLTILLDIVKPSKPVSGFHFDFL